MSVYRPSRRALLSLGIGGALVAATQPLDALAQQAGDVRISSIDVDVRPLLRNWGPNAEIVRREMQQVLRQEFATRLVSRGGARLIVTVNQIFLTAYAGSTGRRGGRSSGGDADDMQSDAVIVDGRGNVLARQSVLSALNSSSGGAWFLPDNDQRRLAALARHNAWWVKVQLVGRG